MASPVHQNPVEHQTRAVTGPSAPPRAPARTATTDAAELTQTMQSRYWWLIMWWRSHGLESLVPWPLGSLCRRLRWKRPWPQDDNIAVTLAVIATYVGQWVGPYEAMRQLAAAVGSLIGHGVTYAVAFVALAFAGPGETMLRNWLENHPRRIAGQVSALLWYIGWCAAGSAVAAAWTAADPPAWAREFGPPVVTMGAVAAGQLVLWMLRLYITGLLHVRAKPAQSQPAAPTRLPLPPDPPEP